MILQYVVKRLILHKTSLPTPLFTECIVMRCSNKGKVSSTGDYPNRSHRRNSHTWVERSRSVRRPPRIESSQLCAARHSVLLRPVTYEREKICEILNTILCFSRARSPTFLWHFTPHKAIVWRCFCCLRFACRKKRCPPPATTCFGEFAKIKANHC